MTSKRCVAGLLSSPVAPPSSAGELRAVGAHRLELGGGLLVIETGHLRGLKVAQLGHVHEQAVPEGVDVAMGIGRAAVDPVGPAVHHAVGEVGVQGDGKPPAQQ